MNINIRLEYEGRESDWVDRIGQKLTALGFLTDIEMKALSNKVKAFIVNNLKNGIDIRGNRVAPLTRATIERKGHSRVFYNTGQLFDSVVDRVVGEGIEVYIDTYRSDIARYLHHGTRFMVARPFFGISEVFLASIRELLRNFIKIKIQRA